MDQKEFNKMVLSEIVKLKDYNTLEVNSQLEICFLKQCRDFYLFKVNYLAISKKNFSNSFKF